MGAGSIVPKWMVEGVSLLVYLAIAVFGLFLVGVCGLVVLNLAKITSWPQQIDLPTALAVIGVSIALMCTVLWFGNRVGILKLNEGTATQIGRVLIFAIAGSVAAGVAAALRR